MLQAAQAKTRLALPRPALLLAIPFLLGILFFASVPVNPGLYLLVSGACWLLALFVLRYDRISTLFLVITLASAGLAAGQMDQFYYPASDIGLFTTSDRQITQIEFTLLDPPRTVIPEQIQRPLPPHQFARASARRILTTAGWQPVTGTFLLHIEPPDPILAAGQTLRATGWLDRPAPAMNPGQFDYASHYRAQRILSTFSIRHSENLEHLAVASFFSPIPFLRTHARTLLDAGFPAARSPDHLLLRALLLGDLDPHLHDIQDLFTRTGTTYLLAISGLHVAILVAFVYLLCRLLRFPPRTTVVITLAFAFLYAAATPCHPPVIRATLLCFFLLIGTLFRRTGDSIQLLALTIFCMLVYSPLDLFDIGFDLSFGTVLGLMLFTRPLTESLLPVDPDLALAPKPVSTRFQLWVTGQKHAARNALFAAGVAWFISLPMILHDFNRLNPYNILASVLLILPVAMSLIAGLLKILLTLLCPPAAPLLAKIAIAPLILLHHAVDLLARLPLSDISLHPLPLPITILFYAILMLTLLLNLNVRLRRVLVITACATVLILPVAFTYASRHHSSETRLTILSVGAGSCAVVETDNNQTFLIDCGSTGTPDLYRSIIDPYLHTRAINHIDVSFISHADFDHYGSLADVARSIGLTTTYFTPQFLQDAQDSQAAGSLLRTLQSLHIPIQTLATPKTLHLSPDTTLDILWPPPDADLDTNDSSMTIRLTVAGRSILFPGDIQDIAMQGLLATMPPDRLHADFLIAPHHGSLEQTTPEFIAAVAPMYILSSDDNTPSHKQLAFDSAFANLPLLHTHAQGAITITIHRDGTYNLNTFLPD